MSFKRAATTDLNHDNWDQDDPADHEKMGSFKQASTDVLEKRVIRTAKRRSTQPYAERQKSVFSGFSGFNKPPPASFDFLANLTNGQSNVKNDSAVSSSFVTSTPLSNNIFMASMTSSENKFNTNSALVKTTPNVFDVSSSTTLNPGSIFTTSIADSTISNSVFKLPTKTTPNKDSTISHSVFKLPTKPTQNDDSTISNSVFKLPTKTTANDFKTPFISNNSKPLQGPTQTTPLFGIPSGNIAPFGKEIILKEPVTSTSKPQNDVFKQPQSANKNNNAQKNNNEEDILMFYASVKKLNETFVEWITINVKNDPICVLTPIFDDYVKHINELKLSYLNNDININDPKSVNKSLEKSKKDDIFATAKSNTQQHLFGIKSTTDSIQEINTETPHNFQYEVKTSTSPSMATFSSSNKTPNEGRNSSSTGNGSIFAFKDKTDTPIVPSNTFNSGSMQQFSFANKSSVTTNTTFSTETINTVTSNPGTQINTPKQSYSFGIKNISSPSTTSSSLFSFTDKSVMPSSSENTPLNTIKTASSFTFGIQNTSKTATDSPTFSFVKKATMDASNNELTTAPSLFSNTNTVSNTPFNTDKVSFESKTPLTAISTTTTATPLFTFSTKTADTDKSMKSSETFSFGTQSTPKTTVDNSISIKSPNFSFGTFNTKPSSAVTENKPVVSQESLLSKNSSFSFTASTLSTPNKVATTSNNSPFGASTDIATPTFSFTKSPSSNSTTSSSLFGQSSTPFSFGTAKPFSFSPNVENKQSNELVQSEDNEEPPKVEYTPVVEEDCVFEKKCKIFSKKDKNYVDMGVGTLYVKKVTESEKHQLLVRANTNIGTVLLNLILSKDIPCQRMGKNNVMLVCIPTPESKPPPTPMLIRVKSAEEADELLDQLKKFQS